MLISGTTCSNLTLSMLFIIIQSFKLGYKPGEPLKVEDVSKFDQMHYYGSKAVDEAVSMLGIR